MKMDEDSFNLEEIESILYAQVFHRNQSENNMSSSTTTTVTVESTLLNHNEYHKNTRNKRYFENNTNPPAIVNNITVNQYTNSPQIIINEKEPRKPKKKQNNKRKSDNPKKIIQTKPPPIVICLSESDVEDKGSSDDETSDDIIYVEPPPVPVVDIACSESEDEEEVAPESEEEHTILKTTNTDSINDFLDEDTNTDTLSTFNFSLLEKDYVSEGSSFVKPSNPQHQDVYQTSESSTTSEQREGFLNSFKTVVFNEVEFPTNESNLFTESGLEKFGELITPQRSKIRGGNVKSKSSSVEKRKSVNKTATKNKCNSSSSSSESDYDEASTIHKKNLYNLPTLSPIIAASSPTLLKRNASKKRRNSSKSVSVSEAKDEEDITNEPNTEESNSRRKRKLSKTIAQDSNEDTSTKKRVSKKQQKDEDNASTSTHSSTSNKKIEDVEADSITNSTRKRLVKKRNQENEEVPTKKRSLMQGEDTDDEDVILLNDSTLNDLVVLDETVGSDVEIIESSNIPEAERDIELSNLTVVDVASGDRTLEDDWLRALFDIDAIRSKMSDNPDIWKISPEDNDQLYSKQMLPAGPRCRLCKEYGHIAVRCPERRKLLCCCMCGEDGHEEARCPNKVCLQCGNSGSYSTTYCWKCSDFCRTMCSICNVRGHNASVCPDLWRRYHLTTAPGSPIRPTTSQLKPPNQQWCSGCAQLGHLDYKCNSYLYQRQYPSVPYTICRYKDVYNSVKDAPKLVVEISSQPNTFNRNVVDINHVINPFAVGNNSSGSNHAIPSLLDRIIPAKAMLKDIMNLFPLGSVIEIKNFVRKELAVLDEKQWSVKEMRRRLYMSKRVLEKSGKLLKKQPTMNRHLNMFVFGVHKFKDGKKHLDYLRNFMKLPDNFNLTDAKRNNLEKAYTYVFSKDLHPDTDYRKMLGIIGLNQQNKKN